MIRRANKNDVDVVLHLLRQVSMVHHELRPDLFKPHTTKYNEADLLSMFVDNSKPVFVYDEGGVLGYAICQVTEVRHHPLLEDVKTLYIDDICVEEQSRGRHIATALFEHVHYYARSIGCSNITLNVWEGNVPALHFYQHMGMKPQKTTMEIIL